MTDPPRWLEEGGDAPDEARELLRHAPRSRPLDRATLIATAVAVTELGARPAIAAALAKLVALPQALAALPVAAKLVTSIALASAVAIVAVPQARSPHARAKAAPHAEPASTPTPTPIPTATPIATPIPIPIPIPTAIPTPIPTLVSTPAQRATHRVHASALDRTASTVVAPAPEPTAPFDSLAAEVAALDTARASLASAPARALHLTDAHATAFPQATLAAERELIAIDALLRLGRHAEARARAERLRTRFPGGLYESRLSALLE